MNFGRFDIRFAIDAINIIIPAKMNSHSTNAVIKKIKAPITNNSAAIKGSNANTVVFHTS